MTEMATEEVVGTIEDLLPYEENNDPNAKAHVIWPPMNDHIRVGDGTAEDIIGLARLKELEVVALCGHKWVPKHNPEKHEACKTCMDIWAKMGI